MISKHIFTSDVVSGKQLYINGLNSTGDLIVATTNFDIENNLKVGEDLSIGGDSILSGNLILEGSGNFKDNLIVDGDLTVNGTTTTVNSTTLTVDDKNIELGSVDTPTNTTADGGGITLKGATDKEFKWTNSSNSWNSSEHLGIADGKHLFTDKVRARDGAGLFLEDDGGNGIFIKDGGNVGIGTTTPSTALEVRFTNTEVYTEDVGGHSLRVRNQRQSPDTFSSLELMAGQTSAGGVNLARIFAIKESATNTATSLAFTTRASNEVVSEAMRINSNGNVGIGTDSPSRVLTINHVHPGIRFEDADGDPAHVTQVSSFDGTLYFDSDMANPHNSAGRTSGKGFVFRTDANTTETPSGNELLVINQDGNVGIGTSSPGYKLHIVQSSGATGEDATPSMKIEGSQPRIWLRETDQTDLNTLIRNNNSIFEIDTVSDTDVYIQNRFAINHGNGNVRINDLLGIGKDPDGYHLDVAAPGAGANGIRVQTNNSSSNAIVHIGGGGSTDIKFKVDGEGSVTTAKDVTIGGDLTVNGTTTTVNSTTVTVDDKNIELGSVASPTNTTADGGGITLKGATDKEFKWGAAADAWRSNVNLEVSHASKAKIDLIRTTTGGGVGGIELISVGNTAAGINNRGGLIDLTTPSDGTAGPTLRFGTRNGTTEYKTLYLKDANVGIGTTSPNDILDITSPEDGKGIRITNGTEDLVRLGRSSTDAGYLSMYDNNVLKVRISSNNGTNNYFNNGGNVGIGTTSPDYELHVAGDGYFAGNSITNIAPAAGVYLGKSENSADHHVSIISSDTKNGYIDFSNTTRDAIGRILYANSNSSGVGSGQGMYFYTDYANNIDDPDVFFGPDGKVGIGTDSPEAKLHIAGNNTNSGGLLIGHASGTGIDSLRFYIDSNNKAHITRGVSEKMTIDSDGKVGIGTTSPDASLHVSGESKLDGGVVITSNSTGIPELTLKRFSSTNASGSDDIVDIRVGDSVLTFVINNDDDGDEGRYNFRKVAAGLEIPAEIDCGTITTNGIIRKNGDTNTYLEFHEADQFRVVTGGAERLEVTNQHTKAAGNLIVGGDLTVTGKTITNDVEVVSTSNGVVFEGSVTDNHEGLLKAGTITGDRTYTLPNQSGTVAMTSDIKNSAITITAGNALTGGGTLNLNQSSAKTITINHQDTSSQGSSNNSGRTYIQDINLDAYGHVTSIGTATETVVDTNTTYSTATSSTAGLVKIGYSENGKNYPVELSGGRMYVNVPWVDTNTNTQRTDAEIRTAVGGSFPNFTTAQNGKVLKVISGNLSWQDDDAGAGATSPGGSNMQVQFNSNGSFGGSANLTFDGTNLYAWQGDIVAYAASDKRLKNNISNISSPIEKIKQINGVNFEWSDKQSTYTGKDVGVIAQDVEKVLPEVVTEREDGYLAVKYEKIIPLLIEAIKDQQKEIEELKSKLS